MIIGKTYTFSAAHHLPGHPKCGRVHGHTYHVTVEIEGELNHLGVVIDFSKLNEIIERILKPLDHENLNNILEDTTCEHISSCIMNSLLYTEDIKSLIPSFRSISVQVKEGEGGYARAMHKVPAVSNI